MAAFVPVQLFGGAITVELPNCFADVRYVREKRGVAKTALANIHSAIREVPDTQEVYLDKDGFTSVIFDLTERIEEAEARTDEEALKYHFQDTVGDSNDVTRFWQTNVATLLRMP